MFVVAMRLAQALRDSGLRCEGVNLFLSVHPSRQGLDEIAARVRAALGDAA